MEKTWERGVVVIEKVSADTVQDITVAYGFKDGAETTPPTAQQLLDKIRGSLASRVKILSEQAEQAKAGETDLAAPPSAFAISLQYAEKSLKEFDDLMKQMPKGFRLVPVLYSKIPFDQNEMVYEEFDKYVRSRFMKFLANEHADELRALGICERGIEEMKKGKTPKDENGKKYHVDIDHIIERSGGGNLSLQQEIDPQMPKGSKPTFLINHFSNFVLLPDQVHKFKNDLNQMQSAAQTAKGQSQWMLMLVPETGPGQTAFVSPPQDQGHPLHGVFAAENHSFKSAGPIAYRTDVAHKALTALLSDPVVAQQIQELKETGLPPQKGQLSRKFNEASKKIVTKVVEPALNSLTTELRGMFNNAVKPGKAPKQYQTFLRVYKGKPIADLRQIIVNLPVDEVERMHKKLQELDRLIKEHDAAPPVPPVNDNATAPKLPMPPKQNKPDGPTP